MAARAEEIAQLISAEVGTPIQLSRAVQAGFPISNFGAFADVARTYNFDGLEVGNSLIVKDPIGVAAAITPWNFPLHQIALKVAPALAAGCTVVLKPSEVAPLSAHLLAEVVDEIGLPPGVFNLLSGTGSVVGEALAGHPLVGVISLTGSTRAGKRVAELAAASVKRVALELGGKSANVILPGVDLEKAVTAGVQNCYLNSGQTCAAYTRMLVPRESLQQVEQIAADTASSFKLGDPTDETTTLGPLVSKVQQERVQGYDTVYGLAGAVWAQTDAKALVVARRLQAGQIEIDGGSFNMSAPFGGFKQSGLGREVGVWGLDEYLETKSLQR